MFKTKGYKIKRINEKINITLVLNTTVILFKN